MDVATQKAAMQVEGVERRLAAILAADVVGYSRLMAADETGTHARLRALRKEFLEPLTAVHHGRIVKLMGDGALVEFASVVDAVTYAVAMQRGMADRQAEFPEHERIRFRIGINIGEVIIEEEDIYGDGVNLAARLEPLAAPGGVCVSRAVYDYARGKVDCAFEPMGEHRVKNIPEPVTAYRVVTGAETAPSRAARSPIRLAALGAAAIAVAAALLAIWLQPWTSAVPPSMLEQRPPLPDKPSLAVLPFDNLSGAADDEYFADGLTDDLITDLSKISGLFVIARNSVFAYKDEAVDIREVARDLGVRYVLEGSVRRAGDEVRINAQLIDGETGNHLWAERYDRDYADIFAVQDEVLSEIVRALSVELTESELTQVARLPTDNLEAYDYYLRAEQELHSPEGDIGILRAVGLYEEAIALDQDFADAYAGYARAAAYLWRFSYDVSMAGTVARSKLYEAAGRALALSPQLPRAHAVLAEAQSVAGEHEAAIQSARRAVDFGPSDAEAHATLASVLAYAGMPAEAVAAAATALRLNPKPPAAVLLTAGFALFLDEQYERAIEALQQARDLSPDLMEPHTFLSMAYAQAGRIEEARETVSLLLGREPSLSLQFWKLMFAHLREADDLRRCLEGLRKAGFPEWPYGFDGRPEDRIEQTEAEDLTLGRIWQGRHESGMPFIAQMSQDGTVAFRDASSMRTGEFLFRDGMLCYRSDDFLQGRASCGYLYRDAEESEYDYVYVNAFSLLHFSVMQ